MMRNTIWTLMAATWLAGGTAAMAQPAPVPVDATPGGARHGMQHRGGPGDEGGMAFEAGRMFATADADHNGQVTREEFTAALAARFAEIDANRDGNVSLDEFRAMRHPGRPAGRPDRPMPQRGVERMDGMFRALDADGNGGVSLPEATVLVSAMFRAMDRDADGQLSAAEARPRGGHGPRMGRHPGEPGRPETPRPG
ncbi:Ca2+-binding EF-hand superfamily protein [Humitalea rosea]|uniref:Ca2+-binding EF-hand superfamily protein n=1 Tax=Humitalea rosea TaxID=990373 RepID=A0A2W7I574_9PROT|nr:hypothetical protein [Humitalea rosea]PZW41349.1 Ca2+-binding EF-hand superfamily protein [Humitalea rosea]